MSVKLRHPLPGSRPTGTFGWRPAFVEAGIYVPKMFHNGQDYAADAGTIIRAAHAGRITYVGWDTAGGGWMVKLSASFGSTLYLHMLERSPFVNPGDEVQAGHAIGRVGMSGTATGNHLHFMLRLNGTDVNPVPYLEAAIPPAPPTTKKEETMAQKAAAFAYTRKSDGAIVYLVIHALGSGIYHEYTDGRPGKATHNDYNAPIARGFGTGNYETCSESHAIRMKAAEDRALTARVKLDPAVIQA